MVKLFFSGIRVAHRNGIQEIKSNHFIEPTFDLAVKNFPGHMLTLSDRTIFTPEDSAFRPAQENLEWHRYKIFL
jgi:hypothetical protein